jgi:hypothetical protein
VTCFSGLVLQAAPTVFMVLIWLPVDFLVESAFRSLQPLAAALVLLLRSAFHQLIYLAHGADLVLLAGPFILSSKGSVLVVPARLFAPGLDFCIEITHPAFGFGFQVLCFLFVAKASVFPQPAMHASSASSQLVRRCRLELVHCLLLRAFWIFSWLVHCPARIHLLAPGSPFLIRGVHEPKPILVLAIWLGSCSSVLSFVPSSTQFWSRFMILQFAFVTALSRHYS